MDPNALTVVVLALAGLLIADVLLHLVARKPTEPPPRPVSPARMANLWVVDAELNEERWTAPLCRVCHGQGMIRGEHCRACQGTGYDGGREP